MFRRAVMKMRPRSVAPVRRAAQRAAVSSLLCSRTTATIVQRFAPSVMVMRTMHSTPMVRSDELNNEAGPRPGHEWGTVKWFDTGKGFGFIVRDTVPENQDIHEIFVHFTAIIGDGYRTLEEGQRVEYTVETTLRGAQAKDVRLLHP